MEDIFNSVTVTITYTPSIKVSVKQTSTSDVLFYFYVVNTTYNNKNTILLKSIGNAIEPTNFNNESLSTIGPQIIYRNNNVLYGRTGFYTSYNQTFIVDSITTCFEEGKATGFIGFECSDFQNPMFVISPTINDKVGFIGITSLGQNNIGIRTLTYNNKTTIEHNLYNLQIKESSTTTMTNMFLPESINGEYFSNIYLITSIEPNIPQQIQYDNHIYLPCMNNHIALKIY